MISNTCAKNKFSKLLTINDIVSRDKVVLLRLKKWLSRVKIFI